MNTANVLNYVIMVLNGGASAFFVIRAILNNKNYNEERNLILYAIFFALVEIACKVALIN